VTEWTDTVRAVLTAADPLAAFAESETLDGAIEYSVILTFSEPPPASCRR
jgi:hypothetical protein